MIAAFWIQSIWPEFAESKSGAHKNAEGKAPTRPLSSRKFLPETFQRVPTRMKRIGPKNSIVALFECHYVKSGSI